MGILFITHDIYFHLIKDAQEIHYIEYYEWRNKTLALTKLQ